MNEFSNTDGELARCIKSRMRHEAGQLPLPGSKANSAVVRSYLLELCTEIINEEF